MKLPQLQTKRFIIRPLSFDDTGQIFEIFSDPAVTKFWGHNTLTRQAEAKEFIQQTFEGAEDESLLEWGIMHQAENMLIGICAFSEWNKEHRRAEIGFALHKEFWRQGIMTEVLQELLNYGFNTLKLHRIEADVDPRNRASIALLEKFGFKKEGLLRERYNINGEIQDALFYGLLKSEFGQ